MSMNEFKKVPKDFLLRKSNRMARTYQTWAMMQLIKNVQVNHEENDDLYEIVAGNFTRFRRRPFIMFVVILIGYFLLRVISVLWLPLLVGTILDFLFAGVLLYMLYWIISSIEENNRRFRKIFLSYEKQNTSSVESSKDV